MNTNILSHTIGRPDANDCEWEYRIMPGWGELTGSEIASDDEAADYVLEAAKEHLLYALAMRCAFAGSACGHTDTWVLVGNLLPGGR